MVHFAPGPKLHQTLTYKADKTCVTLDCSYQVTQGALSRSESFLIKVLLRVPGSLASAAWHIFWQFLLQTLCQESSFRQVQMVMFVFPQQFARWQQAVQKLLQTSFIERPGLLLCQGSRAIPLDLCWAPSLSLRSAAGFPQPSLLPGKMQVCRNLETS